MSPCTVPENSARKTLPNSSVPDRKVPVTADLVAIDEGVAGAVHGLDRIRLVILLEEKHHVPVVILMTGPLPEIRVHDVRRRHNVVTTLEMFILQEPGNY